MADPRKIVDYDGIGVQNTTYAYDSSIVYDEDEVGGSVSVGLAVTFSAANTVGLVADGEFVLGKLIKVESDGFCNVQEGGHMQLPAGTSASLTRGKAIVGDLLVAAKGYIREVATGTAAELGVARGFIHDASDTEAVWVNL